MAYILDCESFGSALTSISTVTGVLGPDIARSLYKVNLEKLMEEYPDENYAQALLSVFCHKTVDQIHFDEVYWFHGTRLRTIDLLTLYKQETSPAIVKFRQSTYKTQYLDGVMLYLHSSASGWGMNLMCNAVLDSMGKTIDAEDIISVQYLRRL